VAGGHRFLTAVAVCDINETADVVVIAPVFSQESLLAVPG
jgi:predicted phosphoribosyltransferase